MIMNRMVKIFLIAAIGAIFVGCYNDREIPSPAKVYTDADFPGQIRSIREVKDLFNAAYPGRNGIGQALEITQDIVIRGKVISSDKAGNVYKTLYIFDDNVASPSQASVIELKLNTGNYIFYAPGRRVYVKLKGLVVGNYRGMISVGTASSDPSYANNNLTELQIEEHIKPGEQFGLVKADTLVVNSTNYATLTENDLGRLVRFEGVQSKYGKANWGYQNTFPNYFANSNSYDVNSPDIENEDLPDSLQWRNINKWATYACLRDLPTPGAAFKTTFFYGSAWFTYGPTTSIIGNYVVRSSGYSNFRDRKIPADGAIVDLTAIYTIFTGTSGDGSRDTYQLVLNKVGDVVVR